jgi:hypothetical protein
MLAAPPLVLVAEPELPVVVPDSFLELTFFLVFILAWESIGLFDFIALSCPPAGPLLWAEAGPNETALISAAAQAATINFRI